MKIIKFCKCCNELVYRQFNGTWTHTTWKNNNLCKTPTPILEINSDQLMKQWYYCNSCDYQFVRPYSRPENNRCPLCDKESQPFSFQQTVTKEG